VAGEKAGSKLAKAEKAGVPILDEAAFSEFLATNS
jgi:DNA ligase (NAD+)